jgi:hypothetical protein
MERSAGGGVLPLSCVEAWPDLEGVLVWSAGGLRLMPGLAWEGGLDGRRAMWFEWPWRLGSEADK